MPTPERVRATVDAYVDGYTRADRDAVLALFRSDSAVEDPVGQPARVGRAGVAELWDQAHAIASQIELVPRDVIVCGREAAMVFEIRVTAGDGGMTIDAVETFEVDDAGRIVRLRAFWDIGRARVRP